MPSLSPLQGKKTRSLCFPYKEKKTRSSHCSAGLTAKRRHHAGARLQPPPELRAGFVTISFRFLHSSPPPLQPHLAPNRNLSTGAFSFPMASVYGKSAAVYACFHWGQAKEEKAVAFRKSGWRGALMNYNHKPGGAFSRDRWGPAGSRLTAQRAAHLPESHSALLCCLARALKHGNNFP